MAMLCNSRMTRLRFSQDIRRRLDTSLAGGLLIFASTGASHPRLIIARIIRLFIPPLNFWRHSLLVGLCSVEQSESCLDDPVGYASTPTASLASSRVSMRFTTRAAWRCWRDINIGEERLPVLEVSYYHPKLQAFVERLQQCYAFDFAAIQSP